MNRYATGSALGLAGIASYWFGRSHSSPPAPTDTGYPASFPPAGKPNSGAPIVSPSPVNPAEFFKYGFPGPVHDLENRQEFVSCYNRATRNPYYVVEHITAQSLIKNGGNGDRKNSVFKEDEDIPFKFRARLRDYFRSGYDRGHQAPAADAKFSQIAMDETFYLTNMSPQVGEGFNRDYWAHLEDFCRRLTKQYENVRVVTGPLFLPKKDPIDGKFKVTYEVIGNPPNVAVPTHFFKLIVAEKNPGLLHSGKLSVAAFVLPNGKIPNETPLTEFEVPIEALEISSGLEFLSKVPVTSRSLLCREVKCEIIVRDFTKAVGNSKPPLALPAPK